MIAFVLAFLISILINFQIDYYSILRFNFTSVYSAARLVGFCDSSLIADKYFGANTIFSYVVLSLFGNKRIERIMQIFFVWNSLILAVIAFISSYISKRKLSFSNSSAVLAGVVSAYITPFLSMIVDQSLFTTLLVWVFVFAYIKYSETKNSDKLMWKIIIGVFLLVTLVIDFRFVAVAIAYVFIDVFYSLKDKKYRNAISSSVIFTLMLALFFLISYFLFKCLFPKSNNFALIVNSPWWYIDNLKSGLIFAIKHIFNYRWVLSLLDVVSGNLVESTVLTFGLITVCLVFSADSNTGHKYKRLFQIISLVLVLNFLYLYFINCEYLIEFHTEKKGILTGCFEVENYGYLLGPMVVLVISQVVDLKNISERKKVLLSTVVINSIGLIYIMASFAFKMLIDNRLSHWFGIYSKPFLEWILTDNKFYNTLMIIVVVIGLAIIWYAIDSRKNQLFALVTIAVVIVGLRFEYAGYADIKIDKSADDIQLVNQIDILRDERVTKVYNIGSFNKTCYLQYELKNKDITNEQIDFSMDSFIIHSSVIGSKISDDYDDMADCYMVQADEDEFYIFKGSDYYDLFVSNGYEPESVQNNLDVRQFVDDIYVASSHRHGDETSIDFWADILPKNQGALTDILYVCLVGINPMNIEYDYDSVVEGYLAVFGIEGLSDEEISFWASNLDTEEGVVHFIEFISRTDECNEVCDELGIVNYWDFYEFDEEFDENFDTNFDKYLVECLVDEIYQAMFDRNADVEGLEAFSEVLINGDYSAAYFMYILHNSEEFAGKKEDNMTLYRNLYTACLGNRTYGYYWEEGVEMVNSGCSYEDIINYISSNQRFIDRCEDMGITAGGI
ncbi:MAG: hypothetical protein MJ093_06420 [Saccharofermentans sp.]|nr:hypothetical protein [Saccharofermentans sp.]